MALITFINEGRRAASMRSSLGVSTLWSRAFCTRFPMIGDNSIPRLASKSRSSEGLKSFDTLVSVVPGGRFEGACEYVN